MLLSISELFSSPGMTTVTVAALIIEILSLGYFGVTLAEFFLLRRKHRAFHAAMGASHPGHPEKASYVILWIYVFSTVLFTVVTSLLFIFQPHIL